MSRSNLPSLLLGLSLLASAAADAAVHPPVPIHTPPLLVPEETAGSGLAPEAAVRVSLDARGRVTAVEVLSIEPANEQEELFRQTLVETLSRWRYAPRVRDGVAEATTLEWRVQFPAKPQLAERVTAFAAQLPGGDAEERRALILALPVAQRLALLEAQAGIAQRLLEPSRATRHASPRFVVHTDADRGETAEVVANNLEAIFGILAQQLLPGIELQPAKYKLQVFVYRDRASYQALLQEMPFYEWSSGFYSPAGLIALHLEQPSHDAVMSLLLHEATHAFFDRHVVRPGIALPRWLGEGFAEYVGNSQVKKGRLLPGKTLARKLELWMGGVVRVETTGGNRLDAAKRALRAGTGLGVQEMLTASPDIFYGERALLYYASSWLLVHYLRDGGAGWAENRFPQLLLYLAEGYPATLAFATIYGDPETLDEAFRGYVKAF